MKDDELALLKTSFRDVRVAAGKRHAQFCPAASAVRFGHALASRYSPKIALQGPLPMVFRRQNKVSGQTMVSIRQGFHYPHWAVNLSHNILIKLSTAPGLEFHFAMGGPSAPRPGTHSLIRQRIVDFLETSIRRREFAEIPGRFWRRRVETDGVGGEASHMPTQPPLVWLTRAPSLRQSVAIEVPPVRYVYRQLPIGTARTEPADSPAPKFGESLRNPTAGIAHAPAPKDIPIDVNRLTDQVIQAIDRRILAYRERIGGV